MICFFFFFFFGNYRQNNKKNKNGYKVDYTFVKGGQSKLNTLEYRDAATFGTGIYFDGTTKLDLNKPLHLGENDHVTEFAMVMRFKPDTVSATGDTVVVIDEGSVVVTIARVSTDSTIVHFTVGDQTLRNSNAPPLIDNDWNTFECGFRFVCFFLFCLFF